ncbi:MAG TPA: hypothetical protein VFE53_14520 [Mucilaginibacter sp.]|nr:hypothetical protein [Mucilaginibacter sp.]
MKKNLIIGTATGYRYAAMQYFFTSLQDIGFDGDVVILVSDQIDPETEKQLTDQGIILVYIKEKALRFTKKYANSRLWKIHYLPHRLWFAALNYGADKIARLSRYVKKFHLISGSRYCFYYDYLLENKDKYHYVLLTDVRDVVFQADPFKDLDRADILNFYEEENTIANSFYTSYWIKHAFGKRALGTITEKMSICSGTTIGSVNRILKYLETMIATQARITAGLTGLGGFDQGVHNYLIYNNYFPGSRITTNTDAEVATLGESTSIWFNDENELVNRDKKVIPVVHQFDRFPEMKFKALA